MKDNDQKGVTPSNQNEDDDTFGLPEIQYEPIQRNEAPASTSEDKVEPEAVAKEPEQFVSYAESVPEVEPTEPEESVFTNSDEDLTEPQAEEPPYQSVYNEMEGKSSIWPKIFAIVLVVVLAAAASWYFLKYKPEQDLLAAERTKLQLLQKQKEDSLQAVKMEEERLQAINQRRLDSLAAIKAPATGTTTALTGKTGKYYVVIASAIDDDLLADKARKLNATGKSCFLIPPFGTTKFSRLALEEKETFDEAQKAADEMKAAGDVQPWVMRY